MTPRSHYSATVIQVWLLTVQNEAYSLCMSKSYTTVSDSQKVVNPFGEFCSKISLVERVNYSIPTDTHRFRLPLAHKIWWFTVSCFQGNKTCHSSDFLQLTDDTGVVHSLFKGRCTQKLNFAYKSWQENNQDCWRTEACPLPPNTSPFHQKKNLRVKSRVQLSLSLSLSLCLSLCLSLSPPPPPPPHPPSLSCRKMLQRQHCRLLQFCLMDRFWRSHCYRGARSSLCHQYPLFLTYLKMLTYNYVIFNLLYFVQLDSN